MKKLVITVLIILVTLTPVMKSLELHSINNLEDVFRSYDEIELLVSDSVQGVNRLRDVLFDIYLDKYANSQKTQSKFSGKFGLHFFQDETLLLGQSMISGWKSLKELIDTLDEYHGMDSRLYGSNDRIFENILKVLDRTYFSSSSEVRKLLTVYMGFGFEDGIDMELLQQVITKSQEENIDILFVEVDGFVQPQGRMFTIQELYDYIQTNKENIENLKKKEMPNNLGRPLRFKNTNSNGPKSSPKKEKKDKPKPKQESPQKKYRIPNNKLEPDKNIHPT